MSDNSDASVSPLIHKGKRKAAVLTDSDVESDSSLSDIDVTVLRRNGKRKNRIRESESDSSVEKSRRIKKVPRVTSDSDSCDDSDIKTKKPTRVVSDDSSVSDSDVSGVSDNGFEDNTSDEWESDWISESEVNQSQIVDNNGKKDSTEITASTSINLGNLSDSSDGESEKCPICLLSFNDQEVGTPETCDHSFCADCIQEWSKNVNTCPVDRQTFTLILVRKRYNGKVIRTVPVDLRRPSVDELIQEDPTFCEICGMSDREDRLLLCDGCDLGYHLECLDPPMDTVPIEEWYCSNCRHGENNLQSHRGNRSEHRLLPRTMQSERVRATIETNRNNSAFNADRQSLSSGFEDIAMPGPSRTSATRNRSRNTTLSRKHKHKKTRKSYKKKRTSYSITYEICDITGEKIVVKKKRKYVKTKKTKRKVKRRRTHRVVKPKTVKKRLAYQLGMCPPKKAGLAIPEVKIKANVTNIGYIGYQRSQAGIPTLHLFGQRDQLDYFSNSEDDTILTSGSSGVLTQNRVVSNEMGALRRAARRKAAVLSPVPSVNVNSVDLLSSILDSQEKLYSKHSVISIKQDGTLHIEQPKRSRKSENNNNDIVKPANSDIIIQNTPLDVNSISEIETTQAPMFPGRGGGGNRQPYGFHNRGGYRGDNRYEGGSGGGYNHFQGGGPRGRGGYGPNMYNRDNFGGGYMNFHHGGPPPPFRGRGGPRFPMRRPQLHQQQPQIINQPEEPVELNLDDPMEQNVSDEQIRQQEEDVDIYSDIETTTPLPDDEVNEIKPVNEAEPEPTLVSQAYNNSGTDDDSGSELVIDDSVKDSEKYDPTQPSADTDSNSEPPINLKETELLTENVNNLNKSAKETETEQQIENVSPDVVLPTETSNITQFSTEVVKEVVQQVIKEHLSTPTNQSVNDNDDDDDDDNDEDCPNFSIYSSTSIDIAKSTEISVDIPNQNNIESQNDQLETKSLSPEKCKPNLKDDLWESGDEWDNPETEMEETLINSVSQQIPSLPEISALNIDNSVVENEKVDENVVNLKSEEEKMDMEEIIFKESQEDQLPISEDKIFKTLKDDTEKQEVDKNDSATTEKVTESIIDELVSKTEDKDGNEFPKADSLSEEIKQNQIQSSATPPLNSLPSIPLPEETAQENTSTSVKVAFCPNKKYQSSNIKKERVLQLYDDSDWEEWESKNEINKSVETATSELVTAELEKMTEAISEEERSYTPCLDEREPVKHQFSDEERNIGAGIGGMDTELISDEERNDFDESHDMKTISDGDALEINAKESELDMTRPEDYEEGEIIEKGAKKTQDNQSDKVKIDPEDDRNKKRTKKKVEKEPDKNKKETDKQAKKPEFKKISKSNKDRNYRDKDKARSKSKERKDKENKENRKDDKKKKERKRDLERYNVRSIIAEKPKKDQFGRDIKSPSQSSRSVSARRSRSHSWNRIKRRRRRSRSIRRSRSRSGSRGYSPRSRSRGRSLRRSRSFRRSRSPRRSRSKSSRRSRSPRSKRHRLEFRSCSRDRDRNRRYRDRSRRRSAERLRNKKKNRSLSRTRLRSRSLSLSKHRVRGEWGRNVDEPRRQSYTREWTPSWSRSPTPPRPVPRHNLPQSMSPSWTPPLMDKGPVQPENLTVILTNNEVNKTKKKEKKKKSEKKSKDEYRKRKRSDRTPPPSKEVFASGDNILVSVSFNKTNEENAVPTREVTGVKRKRDENSKKKKDKVGGEKKKKRAKSPRTKKKNKEIANLKPVAIIDLDRSPFKELTPSPKDIIVLSDSDNCEKEDETMRHHDMMQEELMSLGAQIQEDSAPQSPTANYLNSTGPKTPPEPQIKFLLTSKQTQLRQISNPLHDPNDEIEIDIDPQEELEHRLDDVLHKGPNTPPEPPSSPPSSPDAYDPFDPTKSRSPTPEPVAANQPISSAMNTPGDKTESDGDLVDLAVGPLESSQKSTTSLNEITEKRSSSLDRQKRLSSSPERISQTVTPPASSTDLPAESSDSNKNDAGEKTVKSPERNTIGVVINQQVQPQFPAVVKPIIPTPSVITSTPAVANAALPRTNLFNTPSSVSGTPRIPASVPQRIILPTPSKSSPAKMSPLKTSPSKPPIKSTPIKPMPSKTMISKLPVPNMKPITPVRKGPQAKPVTRNVGQNGNEVIDVDLDFESPYSPGSSDYEDLFEPPAESTKNNNSSRTATKNTTKSPAKQNAFDTLFGSSPVFRSQNNKTKSKTNAAKIPVKMNKKQTSAKAGTKTVGVKIDEDNLKILDDLPNSAVEMQVKDKFLKKLNRQERVVEEVKLVLKPHYNKKHVTKEQYKDILRRAVPKICHNRSGEINPKKIQNLIEAYVKKARHAKKAAAGGATTNTGTTAQQSKPQKTKTWKELFFWCD